MNLSPPYPDSRARPPFPDGRARAADPPPPPPPPPSHDDMIDRVLRALEAFIETKQATAARPAPTDSYRLALNVEYDLRTMLDRGQLAAIGRALNVLDLAVTTDPLIATAVVGSTSRSIDQHRSRVRVLRNPSS